MIRHQIARILGAIAGRIEPSTPSQTVVHVGAEVDGAALARHVALAVRRQARAGRL